MDEKVTIKRVETHLLDETPVSLSDIIASSLSFGETNDTLTKNKNQVCASSETQNAQSEGNVSAKKDNFTIQETLSARNIRVAVVGNVDAGKYCRYCPMIMSRRNCWDAFCQISHTSPCNIFFTLGKSTLIGTLTTSSLDDGRGKCRTSIMKHRHEIESGRTSTATTHLMGFKSTGEPITGKDQIRANKRKTEDEVARESYRVITYECHCRMHYVFFGSVCDWHQI